MTALQLVEQPIANVDAEIGVIGAMLVNPNLVDSIADILKPEDYFDAFLGHVHALIVREHSAGRPVNALTIRPFLADEPMFKEAGGNAWLSGVSGNPVIMLAGPESARQVADMAARRRLIDGLREAIKSGADYDVPVAEVLALADDAISGSRDGDEGRGEHSGAECLKSVIDGFDQAVTGVESGVIPSIDRLLGPMRPQQLIIGAGRPGMGKTATAVSYALGAAEKGHGVLFASLEMSAAELGERMAGDMCLDQRIPFEAIRDRKLSPEQKRHVCRAFDRLENAPLQIIDTPAISTARLRVLVKRWKRRFAARGHKLELVIVDYLQRMQGEKGQDAYARVSTVSAALKDIAKEFDVAVFALAQLSREVEKRADKRPQLSDLRDSGQIEQDADAVLFFLRDEYYLRLNEPPVNDPERQKWEQALRDSCQKIEFICAKRRNGATGSLTGEFNYILQAVRG